MRSVHRTPLARAGAIILLGLGGPALGARLRLGRGRGGGKDYKLQMVNFQNVQYFGDFTIGGQALPVIYDTGSFEIIVLSTMCKKCEKGPTMYDPGRSRSFKDERLVAQHVFG